MSLKDTPNFSVSTWTLIRFFLIALGILLLYLVRDIIIALLFAVIVASAIEPAVEWMKERKIPRILGVILIYLAFAALMFLSIYLIFPLLTDEFKSIAAAYPVIRERIELEITHVGDLPLASFLPGDLGSFFEVPAQYFARLSNGVVNFASEVFGGIFSFLLIIVFSFYLATQEKGIESFLRLIAPVDYEPYVVDLWGRSQRKLGRWFRAQMLLGALVGILIFFGLTFLNVPNALFFAFLSAIFEVIPIVGPILAAVPAVGVAFLIQPYLGLVTVALYIVVQQIESHVIVPVVMKKAIGLSPLIVVLALLVGAKIGGIFGILLSVPLTAVLAEFLNDWDKKKRALMPE